MSKITRLTEQDKARIEQLAAQGLKAPKIAQSIRRPTGTVAWYMYTAGLVTPRESPATATSYMRRGRIVHRYTVDEDALIQHERKAGKGYTEIAKLSNERFGRGRTPHAIHVRLVIIAAREEAA